MPCQTSDSLCFDWIQCWLTHSGLCWRVVRSVDFCTCPPLAFESLGHHQELFQSKAWSRQYHTKIYPRLIHFLTLNVSLPQISLLVVRFVPLMTVAWVLVDSGTSVVAGLVLLSLITLLAIVLLFLILLILATLLITDLAVDFVTLWLNFCSCEDIIYSSRLFITGFHNGAKSVCGWVILYSFLKSSVKSKASLRFLWGSFGGMYSLE